MIDIKSIREKILNIVPNNEGVYLWKDIKDHIIYIGKAKQLQKRMLQYFLPTDNAKTKLLVSKIAHFDYIVVNSEIDALNLEYSLIRKHQPHFNIKLKDGSSYPYIVLTNEQHPRLRLVYDIKQKKDYELIFGPFPYGLGMNTLYELFQSRLPFRKCNILPKRPCIYYYINQCIAPCIHKVTDEDWNSYKKELKLLMTKNTKELKEIVYQKMEQLAEANDFEHAIKYRSLYQNFEVLLKKQDITFIDRINRDFLGYFIKDNYISFSLMIVRNGEIIGKRDFLFDLYTTVDEIINQFLIQHYNRNTIPKELIISSELNLNNLVPLFKFKLVKPSVGQKKHLLELANKNALEHFNNQISNYIFENDKIVKIQAQLSQLLNLKEIEHIEIFDNSHLGGENPIMAAIAFINGKPVKNLYRKYLFTKKRSFDDYKMMEEVIYRHYRQMLLKDLPQPDLIIVDGGKGQVYSAIKSLEQLNLQIPIIGLKKDQKHKTKSIIKSDYQELELDQQSDLYKYLYSLQEEVHRFALRFQQQQKVKRIFNLNLTTIEGIGKETEKKLLNHFQYLNQIEKASLEQLEKIVNKKQAKKIYDFFHNIN